MAYNFNNDYSALTPRLAKAVADIDKARPAT